MSGLSATATLEQAKDWLRRRLDKGEQCPCCQQFAKVYRRGITSTMALALIHIANSPDTVRDQDGFLHVSDYLKGIGTKGALAAAQSADWAKLVAWQFIEQADRDRDDGSSRNGWWRITADGMAFVQDRVTVPRYAKFYDSRVLGLEGDPVGIRDALGKRFDYYDLMQR